MAASTDRFRTALGGFHKGDVTAYIEMTASQHRMELLECEKRISALQEENRSLQQQLNLLMMATPVAAPAPAPAAPAEVSALMQQELQAYRRAEAVERHANIRAKELYQQMEDLCGCTLGDFQAADEAVKQAIEAMTAQAAALEKAYQALSTALNASREKISSINRDYSVPGQDD